MRLISRILYLLQVPLFAVGTQFLTLPSNAEELAAGSHPTAGRFFSVNPAVFTAPAKHPELSVCHGTWLGGVTTTNLAYNQNINDRTLHIQFRYSGLTDIELRDHRPSDEALAYFSSFGISGNVGVSFGSARSRYGLSLETIRIGIYNESAQGLALNAGYLHRFPNKLSLGFSILNIGKMSALGSTAPLLPTRVFVGLAKELNFGDYSNTLHLSSEWNEIAETVQVWVGNIFNWKKLRIMAGTSAAGEIYTASAGMGLQLGQYNISYGIRFGSQDIGLPQSITLHLRLP
tara:strand:+ start:2006 stop:2872 length:867 start_codon:yes stop_codon:yes gene_type:complete